MTGSEVGVYRIPDEPEGVSRLRDSEGSGISFSKIVGGIYNGLWQSSTGGVYNWTELLCAYDVEPIPLTEYEASAEYFQKHGVSESSPSTSEWQHARVILMSAIGG